MSATTLLGYLARFATFSTQSEVLCTQGLAYLLQTRSEACDILAVEIKKRTEVDIGNAVTWIAEAFQSDMGRPDLEARSTDGTPLAKVEAKLGAALLPEQLISYSKDLVARNSGDTALLILLPKGRVEIAEQACDLAFGQRQQATRPQNTIWRSGTVNVAILTWDELFDALQTGGSERYRFELEQLQAMYREFTSDYIAPLASDEDLRQWKSSETDFFKLVDQVTRRLTTRHRVYPQQTEVLEQNSPELEPVEYRFRYVCPGINCATSCYSVGVRDSFKEWLTPIWMRFHKDTGNFLRLRQRVESSRLRSLSSEGHVWIPLDVPFDVGSEQMIMALIEQVEQVLAVAYGT